MDLGGKGNAITSTTTMISTKSLQVKAHTNQGKYPYPDPEGRPTTRGDQAARYRECMKNHAALTGGHVVDGCCEFMAGGEEGTLGELKCAACNCHRSFHRKEVYGHRSSKQEMVTPAFYCSSNSLYKAMQPRGVYPMAEIGRRTSSSSEDMKKILSNRNQDIDVMKKMKRMRTKINEEKKKKMKEFAERLGWRMQKKDDEEIVKFCRMVNLRREVFKVWMHYNKQATKKNRNTSDLQN